ncbi:MAG: hypothetical protein KKC51_07000 [Verrucomicrobia bacterium]|nr:hypothetical protein [Verrucomicrobiota bacterium]
MQKEIPSIKRHISVAVINILVLIIGFAFGKYSCYTALKYTISRRHSLESGLGTGKYDFYYMNADDRQAWGEIEKALFKSSDIDLLNKIFAITEGDVDLQVIPLTSIEPIEGVVVLISLRNNSDRKITILEPKLTMLSAPYSTTLRYAISCNLDGATWCRILAPGAAYYHPVWLSLEKNRHYKAVFSLAIPHFLCITPLDYDARAVAQSECEFSVQ